MIDSVLFARWCWGNDYEALAAFLATRAQALTDASVRGIPGVEVRERKEVA